MRVLIIDSSARCAALIRSGLADQGYVAETCASAERGCDRAASGECDVVLLAGSLPDGDAAALCRLMRSGGVRVPILVYFEQPVDGMAAPVLDAGADACIVAPWKDMELLAAEIRAVLRRDGDTFGEVLRLADIELNLARRTVRRAGQRIELTKKEFELLHVLIRNHDRVMSRTSIGVRIWGEYFDTESNVVDVCVSNLRRKVDNGFDCKLIRTIRGSGYMLSADAEDAVNPCASNRDDGRSR